MEAITAKGISLSRSAGENRRRLPGLFSCIAIGITAAVLLTGCSSQETKEEPRVAVPVSAVSAQEKNIPQILKTIGSVEASQRVSIRARIGGALTRIAFKEGQDVLEGDLLFLIDPRPYEKAVAAALANLARDQAQLANAQKDAFRYEALGKEELVTKQQLDQVLTTLEVIRNTVRSGEAAVETARLNLQYCYITAPIAGRTGIVTVHAGDQIEADGAEMVSINRITPVNVNFSLPEKHLTAIRAHARAGSLPAAATIPDDPGKPSLGVLSFIDNAVDTATGTIRLKATFPNTDKRLWPGQFVHVSLTLTVREHSVVVPSQAIQIGQQGPFLFVVQSDLTVVPRLIAPGQEIDGATVIEKGLQSGETVVTDGQLRLVPGAKVEIKNVGLEKGG